MINLRLHFTGASDPAQIAALWVSEAALNATLEAQIAALMQTNAMLQAALNSLTAEVRANQADVQANYVLKSSLDSRCVGLSGAGFAPQSQSQSQSNACPADTTADGSWGNIATATLTFTVPADQAGSWSLDNAGEQCLNGRVRALRDCGFEQPSPAPSQRSLLLHSTSHRLKSLLLASLSSTRPVATHS